VAVSSQMEPYPGPKWSLKPGQSREFGLEESLTVSFTGYRLIGRPADSMTGNLGYGVIGSPADSGSVSLGSSPGTPANNARPRCLAA
jgi:hypothetical protein